VVVENSHRGETMTKVDEMGNGGGTRGPRWVVQQSTVQTATRFPAAGERAGRVQQNISKSGKMELPAVANHEPPGLADCCPTCESVRRLCARARVLARHGPFL
jgi:hypothetical protein